MIIMPKENLNETILITILTYNHIFHIDYIDIWLKDYKTCPVCKKS